MRLIDADALKETIASNVYMVVDYFNSKDFGMFWTGGIEKAIDEQPTIEKQGRWMPCKELAREMLVDKTVEILYDHYECSLCRCTLPNLLYNQDGKPIYKFCPNCGAKMEEAKQ